MGSKRLNFLKRYEDIQKERNKLTPAAKKQIILGSILALIVVLACAALIFKNYSLTNKIDENYAFLNDPVNIEHSNEVIQKDKVINRLNGAISDIDNMQEMGETFPEYNANLINVINGFEGVSATRYNFNANTLSMHLFTSNSNNGPLYVDYLKATGLFDEVSYHGFDITDSGYSFDVNCTFDRGVE